MKNFNRTITPLCFTANTAGSTIKLKAVNISSPNIETSTDGSNWSVYAVGNTITLSNVGDKVYMRTNSTTTTRLGSGTSSYHMFEMTGSIAASGDITSLINKDCTDTISFDYCLYKLFNGCTSLTTPPLFKAANLANDCYRQMFVGCTNLIVLPNLPAISINARAYQLMFGNCSKIKLSTTQTGEYQTEYRIPITGTGTTGSNSLQNMFYSTGGTFTGTPSINTTYYTSNTLV